MKPKLVILGAGIGGLSVLKELANSGVYHDDLDITIVDENFTHFMGFTLPWVMRGWRDRDTVPIRPDVNTFGKVLTVRATASHVDPDARTVTLSSGSSLAFDALVVATGARNAIDKVPGLRRAVDEHTAVHYYSAEAAADAHQALNRFDGGKLVFLVTSQPYRCPVAPYEGAMLAADLLRDNGTRDVTDIRIFSPEPHPMPSAGPYAGPELVKMLHDNNIEFAGNHVVHRIDARTRTLYFNNGNTGAYDLLIFVPPHEPALPLGGPGWISVDANTMQTSYPGIFAIGDTTIVTSPSGRPLPKAAIFAKNGAKAAAVNVLHYLGMTQTTTPLSGEGYCYLDTGGHAAALGKGNFFTTPHPAIHLSAPSAQLHREKQDEERDWRATWEPDPALANE
jgi:sulfide:quinone oxidoreductase